MISLCVVARDEEKRIRGCVENGLQLCDEALVVVDERTTDQTAREAWDAGAYVLWGPPRDYAEDNRGLAQNLAHGDWLLFLDADEMITDKFIEDTPWLMDRYDGVCLPTEHWFGGELWNKNAWEMRYRFAKRDAIFHIPGPHTGPMHPPDANIYAPDYCALMHVKTWGEQHFDDERYKTSHRTIPITDPRVLV